MRILKPLPGILPMPGHPLADAIGLWPMTSLGNKVFDLSRYDYTGNITTPDWRIGTTGHALNMVDGSSNYITFTNKSAILAATAFTVVFRSNPVSNDENMAFAFTQAAPYPALGLPYLTANYRPLLYMGGDNYRYFSNNSPTNYLDGNIHTFAVVVPGNAQTDINNALLYIDGIPQDIISTQAAGGQSAKTDFLIGSTGLYGRHFSGTFEYFYFFNRVLIASEIALLYREHSCMFPENIMPEFAIAA